MSIIEGRNTTNEFGGIVLGKEQNAAFNLLETSDSNFFLTGKAGTGKSVLLQYFVEHTKKSVAVVAPTGAAAINIGGQTIHSFFSLDTGVQRPESPDSVYHISEEKVKILQKLDTLVIDEASMVRADVMEMISAKLKAARQEYFEPFGGCQIIAVGDLYQLPPVDEKDLHAHVYLADHYDSLFFFDAPSVKAFPFTVIELQHIYRQSDNDFIQILNSIRNGDNSSTILKKINKRYLPNERLEDIVTLTCTNSMANSINAKHLSELDGCEYVYEGITQDYFDPKDTIAEQTLRLKVGARVIMLKNDPQKRWINGTIGIVKHLTDCSIIVEIDGAEYPVSKDQWDSKCYRYNRYNRSLEQEIIGSFIQYPLKLAYALTIHKSQGQTYDGAIIDLADKAFTPGQAYVALSRCRSIDNLYLASPLKSTDITADHSVISYMKAANYVELFGHECKK